MTDELIIGLMSGTSVDGIDAALLKFQSHTQLTVVDTLFTPFSANIQQEINLLSQQNNTPKPNDYNTLSEELAQLYAEASLDLIKKSGVSRDTIKAIANHGQTIAHEPNADPPYSLQIGKPQLIAELTGISTISKFRQADLLVGGQGAPLMPAFHQAIFSKQGELKNIFILNLGGIANISSLGKNVIGFDTGPANTLLNQWINHQKGKSYDENGQWAKTGKVITPLLKQLLNDEYFTQPYPKSTGPDHFNLTWLEQQSLNKLDQYLAQDVQATLLELSTTSIAAGFELLNAKQGIIYVCGGGVHNQTFMNKLRHTLNSFEIKLSDEIGIPADWVEAAGFAWLGYCHLHNIPSNLPSVTGASQKAVLGECFEPEQP